VAHVDDGRSESKCLTGSIIIIIIIIIITVVVVNYFLNLKFKKILSAVKMAHVP